MKDTLEHFDDPHIRSQYADTRDLYIGCFRFMTLCQKIQPFAHLILFHLGTTKQTKYSCTNDFLCILYAVNFHCGHLWDEFSFHARAGMENGVPGYHADYVRYNDIHLPLVQSKTLAVKYWVI